MHPCGVQGMWKGMDVKSVQLSLTAPSCVEVEKSLAVFAGWSPSTSCDVVRYESNELAMISINYFSQNKTETSTEQGTF